MPTSPRPSDAEIECSLVWDLARSHAWSRWIPEAALLDQALPSSEQGRARRNALPNLRSRPFVAHRRDRGLRFVGNSEEGIAAFLRDECGYGELRIEATLSHFDGFD